MEAPELNISIGTSSYSMSAMLQVVMQSNRPHCSVMGHVTGHDVV